MKLYKLLRLLTEMVSYSAVNTTAKFVSKSEIAVVRYAYVTIGGIVSVAIVLYAAAYWQDRHDKHAHDQQMHSTQQTTRNEGETEIRDTKPAERHCREK